jgi:uncharacterized protein (TIGR03067 family)
MTSPLAATLLASLMFAPGGDAAKKELAKLQGTWMTVSVEINGQKVEEDFTKDRLIIKGDTFVLQTGGTKLEGVMSIDPTKDPKTIDTTVTAGQDKGLKSVGIYELKGDTFRVCYCVSINQRPTEFRTTAGSSRALVVYRRVSE